MTQFVPIQKLNIFSKLHSKLQRDRIKFWFLLFDKFLIYPSYLPQVLKQ